MVSSVAGCCGKVVSQPSTPSSSTALLREAYDKDGNGHIATDELVESAKLAIKTRKCNSMLWKFLF